MKTVFHKSDSRGHANHGWLNSHHTFSFANYHNPERMNFGVLRVLNDDVIAGGAGFGTHPHNNMEIISIPLKGAIAHKDNMGNSSVISDEEIQVMSAGTGISHSEFNAQASEASNFLQIWVYPNKRDVSPRYDQQKIAMEQNPNQFLQILSPNADDDGVWIHQDAWFYMGNFNQEKKLEYELNKAENGVYVFVIDGALELAGQKLEKRDGMGLWEIEQIQIHIKTAAKILLMEVPMSAPIDVYARRPC